MLFSRFGLEPLNSICESRFLVSFDICVFIQNMARKRHQEGHLETFRLLNRARQHLPLLLQTDRKRHRDRQTDEQPASQPADRQPNPGRCGCCPVRRFQHTSAHHSLLCRGRHRGVVGAPHRRLGGQPPCPVQSDVHPLVVAGRPPPPNVWPPVR